jgi:hypothetical protein
MLEWLKLENVGPAPKFELDFAPRVNLITGDNGLGKSFLLDVAWFALSGYWRDPVLPRAQKDKSSSIKFRKKSVSFPDENIEQRFVFDPREQKWNGNTTLLSDVIVISCQVNDELSIFDSLRNNDHFSFKIGSPKGFVFHANEIWNGIKHDQAVICNGLIQNWANWQRENNKSFQQLKLALVKLSPDENEVLVPGSLTRIGLNDVRDLPTIKMPYGQDVPITHSSAGIKRITSLAYALVWTWQANYWTEVG